MIKKSCRLKILEVLKSEKRPFTNEGIRSSILARFGSYYQNNTIAKELSFLLKEKKVKSSSTPCAHYYNYELINDK